MVDFVVGIANGWKVGIVAWRAVLALELKPKGVDGRVIRSSDKKLLFLLPITKRTSHQLRIKIPRIIRHLLP
ncbi:MAG: hypothetical protein AB8H12_24125, partial [Lewinella sp.]